jgi:hypothetical protein
MAEDQGHADGHGGRPERHRCSHQRRMRTGLAETAGLPTLSSSAVYPLGRWRQQLDGYQNHQIGVIQPLPNFRDPSSPILVCYPHSIRASSDQETITSTDDFDPYNSSHVSPL